MGFMDRVGKMVNASYDAIKAPIGFVSDVATSPWRQDEVDGVAGTVFHAFTKRGNEFLRGGVAGEESVAGYGARQVYRGAKPVFKKVGDGLDWAYREAVSQPLATMLLTDQLYRSKTWQQQRGNRGWKTYTDPETWKKAKAMAETTSPGQAMASNYEGVEQEGIGAFRIPGILAPLPAAIQNTVDPEDEDEGYDILDPQQQEAFAGTDGYKFVSGTWDAAARIFLDPTVVGGKAVMAARGAGTVARKLDDVDEVVDGVRSLKGGRLGALNPNNYEVVPRSIGTAADRNKYLGSKKAEEFLDDIEGKSAVELRDTYFKDNEYGSVISTLVADGKTREQKRLAMAALMGDETAKGELAQENLALVNAIDRAETSKDVLTRNKDAWGDSPEYMRELDLVEQEVKELRLLQDQREFITGIGAETGFQPLREAPSFSAFAAGKKALVNHVQVPEEAGRIRTTVKQINPLYGVVRQATTWKPGGSAGVVNLHGGSGDRELSRYLQKAGLTEEESVAIRDSYMRAGDELTRSSIWAKTEEAAVAKLARDSGLDEDEIGRLVNVARSGRKKANDIANIHGRVYDGGGSSRVRYMDDETGEYVNIPLLNTQLENVHFISDIDEMKRAINKMGRFKARFGAIGAADRAVLETQTLYNRVWKPTTLLRLGWPQRVVADEQMRVIAKIGALSQAHNLTTATGNFIKDRLKRVDEPYRIPGQRKWDYNGYQMPSAFAGRPGDAKNMYESLNRARGAIGTLYGGDEQRHLAKLRGEELPSGNMTRQWSSVNAVDNADSHATAWVHDVNNQIGQDSLARLFLQNKTVDDAVEWLKTPEGRAHASRNKLAARNPQRWAAAVEDQVRRYTMDSEDIKTKALQGSLVYDDLVKIAPDPSMRPEVHGEILQQSLGNSQIVRMWNGFVEKGYEALGEKPSGFLSRNPFFDTMYRNEMKRLVDTSDNVKLSQDDLDNMAGYAREFALKETRDLLYDLGEQSDLEQTLRFFMPFYGAWQEVLTRWAGLSVENPAFVARVAQVWKSPEKAGIVTDENGNQVYEDGSALTPDGVATKAGKERFLNVPLPSYANDLPVVGGAIAGATVGGLTKGVVGAAVGGVAGAAAGFQGKGGLEGQEKMLFNKKSLNLVLQGPPGIGPMGQLAINEIVKDNPSMESSVKWALPFGTTQEIQQILLPTGMKRAQIAAEGEDNRTFQNSLMKIYYEQVTDYELGIREELPSYEEAKDQAQKLAHVRTLAAYVMPFQPSFKTPYQPYVDAMRSARERLAEDEKKRLAGIPVPPEQSALGYTEDAEGKRAPKSADEWFYDTYGKEFFALTMSMSKSNDGVPPTLEGRVARGKYRDLIEEFPDYGGLIVGSEGAGEFMGSAYAAQFADKLKPGSDVMQRETPSFDESTDAYEAKMGWMEFGKTMDLIEAERISRDLPSLRSKEAGDLADMKAELVEALGAKYPGWLEAYSNTDSRKNQNHIKALRRFAEDDRLRGRDDIQGLSDYLNIRDQLTEELNYRKRRGGASTLDSDSNADLDEMWSAAVGDLVERNMAFQSLYYRYLDNDAPEAGRIPNSEKSTSTGTRRNRGRRSR